jgi:hypothetical protein
MYPHRIRLRGPWEFEPLTQISGGGDQPLPRAIRIRLPCRLRDAGLAGFTGRVWFRRRFGYPGRIDDYERVWLTFAGVTGSVEIRLNDHLLGRFEELCKPAEFDVTSLLGTRNELVVEVESSNDEGGLWGEVALEVRCTAYLRAVQVAPEKEADKVRLRVSGEVVGVCPSLLELYVVAGRSTVAYYTIEATPDGQPFQVTTEPLHRTWEGECPVRVELVNAASVWFAYETFVSITEEHLKR